MIKIIPVRLVVSRIEKAKIPTLLQEYSQHSGLFPSDNIGQTEARMSHTSCELNSNQAGGDNSSQSLADPSRTQLHCWSPW